MAQLQLGKVCEALRQKGFNDKQTEEVKQAIQANLPPETYNKAMLFLGWVTVVLAVGSIIFIGLGREVPEALWAVLGAGIGGLAGIFVGKQ